MLGELLTGEILRLASSGDAVEGYGKAALVGMDGELEHASALIHTLRFGNKYRKAVGAKSYLAFTKVRGRPNCPVMIPLMHKADEGMRSHYVTIHFFNCRRAGARRIRHRAWLVDGGRPHHRIGDRYKDIEELGSNEA